MPGDRGKESKDKGNKTSTRISNYTVNIKDGKRTSSVLSPAEQEAQKKKPNLNESETSTVEMDEISTEGDDTTLVDTGGLDQNERLDILVTTHVETKMAEHNITVSDIIGPMIKEFRLLKDSMDATFNNVEESY